MKDQALIRIAEETTKALADAHPYSSAKRTIPSYNALLSAAKANHPGDPFLSALPLFELNRNERGEEDSTSTAEMIALFAQIRIVLESLMEESGTPPPAR